MELVRDVHASFDDTFSKPTKRSHYEVLNLCAGTLSILLVQAFDQHSKYDSEQLGAPTTPGFGADFVGVVAKLLESHHPIDFRVSFSRVVPAVSTRSILVLVGYFSTFVLTRNVLLLR